MRLLNIILDKCFGALLVCKDEISQCVFLVRLISFFKDDKLSCVFGCERMFFGVFVPCIPG